MVRALLDGRKTQTRRLATSPLRRAEVGDRLWVRETFRFWSNGHDSELTYAADNAVRHVGGSAGDVPDEQLAQYFRMCDRSPGEAFNVPSIHMPRWASRRRLALEVIGVRIENLQAITREDAAAEGHPRSSDPFSEEVHLDAARDWYMDLWDSLHPKQPWSTNPVVVALEFEVASPVK